MPGDASKSASSYGPESSTEATKEAAPAAEEDDDIDLFGSDEDEEEDQAAIDLREKRLAEYAAKKAGKEKPAAKSVVTMDVKPWDDETDMKELEKSVRSIEMDGLVWGGSKLVPVGYGVSKLQINLVIEDDKVGLDDLQDAIAEFEDYVQSSDVSLPSARLSREPLLTKKNRLQLCRSYRLWLPLFPVYFTTSSCCKDSH